jgi:predicted GNAT family acetyltransferase
MSHPLDRPVWNALTTRQAPLAIGDAAAVKFDPRYALFIAAADPSPASLAALAALVPDTWEVATVEADPWPSAPGVTNASQPILQMLAAGAVAPPARDHAAEFEIVDLTEADAPAMLALARETRPGPFFSRTHQLGDFVGVKDAAGRLLAMAGERMKPAGFTEVSGVCTAPDARGRGLAGALTVVVARRIIARGEAPFLHVYPHNTGAIALYQTLGFALRRQMIMTALTRPAAPPVASP